MQQTVTIDCPPEMMMGADERGWYAPDGYVCVDCVDS